MRTDRSSIESIFDSPVATNTKSMVIFKNPSANQTENKIGLTGVNRNISDYSDCWVIKHKRTVKKFVYLSWYKLWNVYFTHNSYKNIKNSEINNAIIIIMEIIIYLYHIRLLYHYYKGIQIHKSDKYIHSNNSNYKVLTQWTILIGYFSSF